MSNKFQAQTKQHFREVEELFWEYLEWANGQLDQHYGFTADIESMQAEAMQKIDQLSPPHGCILLAEADGKIAGIGCLKNLGPTGVEIKRMYVRTDFRRNGLGRALLEGLLAEARSIGYETIRLDSTRFMTAAHSLYRSNGFTDIDAYTESEIPPEYQQYWLFMELRLED